MVLFLCKTNKVLRNGFNSKKVSIQGFLNQLKVKHLLKNKSSLEATNMTKIKLKDPITIGTTKYEELIMENRTVFGVECKLSYSDTTKIEVPWSNVLALVKT